MTKRQYTSEVNKLWKRYKAWSDGDYKNPFDIDKERSKYYQFSEDYAKALKDDLYKLWTLDREKELVNVDTLKKLLCINQSVRAINLHNIVSYKWTYK